MTFSGCILGHITHIGIPIIEIIAIKIVHGKGQYLVEVQFKKDLRTFNYLKMEEKICHCSLQKLPTE